MMGLPWWAIVGLVNAAIVLTFGAVYWVEVELVGTASVTARRRWTLAAALVLVGFTLGGFLIAGVVIGTQLRRLTRAGS